MLSTLFVNIQQLKDTFGDVNGQEIDIIMMQKLKN